MTFAQLVQAAKDARGWSIRQLCAQSGVTYGTLRRFLSGQDPKLSTALKLAAALGMPASDLAGRDATPWQQLAGTAEPEQLRCYECRHCDRFSSLVCNIANGCCHKGDCEPEPEADWCRQ